MMKRTRLVVAAVTLVTLAATGTAAAAGPAPTPGAVQSGCAPLKPGGRPEAGTDADLAAIAAKLGVTTERLDAALVAAKTSLANSASVTPDAFIAAVATNLGLPIPQVQDALQPMVAEPAPTGDDQGKLNSMDKKGVDGPQKPLEGKPRGAADADLAAIAAKLGVTTERLDAALVAAKTADLPPESFVSTVAATLGLPVSQVQDALGPMVDEPAPDGDNQGKLDSMGTKARDGSPDSPFTTDAASASLAAALGVDQAKAKAALAALVALGRVRPTSKAFGDIAASLGVGSDQLDAALRELKRSLSQG
ncbi:hypothetical protein [Microbispora rosea]|uniref:hypothetical protein n=1 Tax=Microbispora rosea TaxID=58117 RepID=UPI0004C3D032|nr:hypothetical protein [Microbispora rosea]